MPGWISGSPNKSDLENASVNVQQQQQQQLHVIVDLLRTPFQYLENWQVYLQEFFAELKEKVQQFQQNEMALASVSTSLVDISHDEKLAQQTLEQFLQQYRDKQVLIRSKSEERQILSTERARRLVARLRFGNATVRGQLRERH